MNQKRMKISIIINIIIVFFTMLASVFMFTGFKFMHGYEPVLESTKFGVLRFFTVQSNLFMGIIAFFFTIKEIKLLNRKIVSISKQMYLLKLLSTTSVSLTFMIVFTYLGPISKGGVLSLLINSNLFFHLIIPLLSIVTFVFFEKNNQIRFKDSFYGIIPTFLYGVFYLANILLHMENGKVSPIYDWYFFVQNGVWTGLIVGPMILLITYIICLILWKGNKISN